MNCISDSQPLQNLSKLPLDVIVLHIRQELSHNYTKFYQQCRLAVFYSSLKLSSLTRPTITQQPTISGTVASSAIHLGSMSAPSSPSEFTCSHPCTPKVCLRFYSFARVDLTDEEFRNVILVIVFDQNSKYDF